MDALEVLRDMPHAGSCFMPRGRMVVAAARVRRSAAGINAWERP
jgi:hypothetical protein